MDTSLYLMSFKYFAQLIQPLHLAVNFIEIFDRELNNILVLSCC